MSQCFSSINHQMYNVLPTWASSGTFVVVYFMYVVHFDDLLKRNIVTCVIRPKINIIQVVQHALIL